MAELKLSHIYNLRHRLAGDVWLPGDLEYEAARQVWNAAIGRRPAVIVRPAHEADAEAAVRFAAERALPISVRSGAHNHAGYAVADGALMVDLGAWRTVQVDPAARTATAQAGARWGDVDAATDEFGLATTGADMPVVGLGGHVLGGGFGWLHRRFGLACDNLLRIRLITADGETKIIDNDSSPDLFWALRGGGGAFGVVTGLTLQLHAVEAVYTSEALIPLDQAREGLHAYREMTLSAPDELFVRAMLVPAPAAPFVPENLRGRRVLMITGAWIGDPRQAVAGLQPITALGGAPAQPSNYLVLQRMHEQGFPGRIRAEARSHFVDALSDALLDALIDVAANSPGLTMLSLQPGGGAVSRIAADATAFPYRYPSYHLHIQGMASANDDSERHINWVRAADDRVRPEVMEACYGNVAMGLDAVELAAAAYGPNLPRLTKIKNSIDPANLFRFAPLGSAIAASEDQSTMREMIKVN